MSRISLPNVTGNKCSCPVKVILLFLLFKLLLTDFLTSSNAVFSSPIKVPIRNFSTSIEVVLRQIKVKGRKIILSTLRHSIVFRCSMPWKNHTEEKDKHLIRSPLCWEGTYCTGKTFMSGQVLAKFQFVFVYETRFELATTFATISSFFYWALDLNRTISEFFLPETTDCWDTKKLNAQILLVLIKLLPSTTQALSSLVEEEDRFACPGEQTPHMQNGWTEMLEPGLTGEGKEKFMDKNRSQTELRKSSSKGR